MTKSLNRKAPNSNIFEFVQMNQAQKHMHQQFQIYLLSTGTEMEHVDEHDGGSVEEDDVKDD